MRDRNPTICLGTKLARRAQDEPRLFIVRAPKTVQQQQQTQQQKQKPLPRLKEQQKRPPLALNNILARQ